MTTSTDSTTQPPLELSIVMPCLNEAETLEVCITKARQFLDKQGIAGEIIVGDNGSTDDSQDIAARHGARVVHVPVRGYGAAVYHAVKASHGRYVIMGDADDSYDFANLQPFVDKLREGYDLVMGNRFKGGIKPGAMPWRNRYLGNPVLTCVGRLFFQCPAKDFHCGLRGFQRAAFDRMDLRTTGMEFASEMVIKATMLDMRIAEVPTTLSPAGRSRPPHLRPIRDGWRHLRFMLLFSPRWLFLYPGLLLMVMGSIAFLWLWPQRRYIGDLSFDVHSLIYAAVAILLGYQAVAFAYLSKVFVTEEGLIPKDDRLIWLQKHITLEVGLIVGGFMLLTGLATAVVSVWIWSRQSFGELDPRRTLRVVIPAALALMLGCQIILNSFFLSVMGLKIRRL